MKTIGKLMFAGLASMVASLAFAGATMKDVETAVDVNKDYRQAENLIREVVANSPKDARDHYVYSQILHHNGKHDDAVRELAEAKRLDPAISFVKNPSRVAAYEAELNAEVHRYTPAPAQPRVERYTPPPAVAMPQEPIPQQKPGHTLLWVVLILAVLGVAGFFFYRRTQAHDQAEDEQRTKAARQDQLKQANGLLETVKPFKLDIRMANPANPELLAKVEQVEQELVGLIERLAQTPVPQAEIDRVEESLAHLHRVFEGKPDPLPSAHHVVDSTQGQSRDDNGFRPVAAAAAPVYQQPIYQQPMPQTVYVENNPGGMGVGGGLLTGMVLGGLMGGGHDREVIREIREVPSQRYEDDGGNQPSDIDFGNESSSDSGSVDFGDSDDS
jgi:tetratricopeptide (TPR) repeat protein